MNIHACQSLRLEPTCQNPERRIRLTVILDRYGLTPLEREFAHRNPHLSPAISVS